MFKKLKNVKWVLNYFFKKLNVLQKGKKKDLVIFILFLNAY